MMNAFFEQFAAEVSTDIHVVMVWDQAGFHTSKKLKVPENATIVPLPPYSPELNPAIIQSVCRSPHTKRIN